MKTAILGGGSYAAAIIAYLQEFSQLQPSVVLDDDLTKHGQAVAGVDIIGGLELLPELQVRGVEAVVACLGDNRLRTRLHGRARELDFRTPGFLHPAASVARTATIGEATLILDGAVVQPWVTIGDSCIVSSNVTVAHHTRVGSGVSLAAGTTVGAGIDLGEYASFGVAASAMTGVKRIGPGAVVGAGAAVIRDVEALTTVVGVPARPLPRAAASGESNDR